MDRQMQGGLRGFYERRVDRLREGLLTEEDIVEQCRKRRAIRATESRLDALDDDSGEEQEDDEAEPTTVGVLIIKDGNVLAGVRKSDFCPFTICGPGGHIEAGETPEEAAVRETQEEFGVTPTELVPIGMQTEQEERFGRNMLYLCTEYDGQISTDNVEIVAPHWLDYSEAVEAAKNGNEALFLSFARSLIVLDKELEKISEENGENFIASPEDKRYNDSCNEDGNPGSGNWGHKGRPGKRGGSGAGGGVENRISLEGGDYTSKVKLEKLNSAIASGRATREEVIEMGKKYVKVSGPKQTKQFTEKYFSEHPEVAGEAKKYSAVLENVKTFDERHKDLGDGTYDAITEKGKEYSDGFSVSFHQNLAKNDPFGGYDSDTYADMCAITKNELSSDSVDIGYFDNPEVSFHCATYQSSMKYAIEHNQHSIWDCAEGCVWENPYFNPETNPVKTEEE